MADRVLITTDDLEQAVRINASLEASGYDTATVSSLDDVRSAVRGREPDAIVLTGGLHESTAQRLLAAARDHAVSTLGLVEPTDDDPSQIGRDLGLTGWLVKPVDPGEVTATVRRLIDRRHLQQRTGILGESPPIQEVLVKIEQMAAVTSPVLLRSGAGGGGGGRGRGGGAEGYSRPRAAPRQGVHRRQLRRAARDAARERAVR